VPESFSLRIDVTEAAGLGQPAEVALTVHLPDAGTLPARPVVCFAKPGGGYSKGYFTTDLPGPGRGAQADWHARRGWVFVSVDHLGVGESTVIDDAERLNYTNVTAASQAAERQVLARLGDGTLADGFPALAHPLTLGIGQSMGGCLTVVQQGRFHCYHGIGVLGYSAVHTTVLLAPGLRRLMPWVPRDVVPSSGIAVAPPAVMEGVVPAGAGPAAARDDAPPDMAWGFHFDDVDVAIQRQDLEDFPTRNGHVPPWGSATLPGCIAPWCMAPGAIAPEAAAVTVPVLVAMGERDVIEDPRGEVRAYKSSPAVDLFICPRMGHMHNFAGTRELFWHRIETWAAWVQAFDERSGLHR